MKKNIGILILISLLATTASAQKLKGKIDFLKGQETLNIVFDFNGVTMDGESESAYVKERMADKETTTEADAWKAEWEGAVRERFKEAYIKYCNDELKNTRMGVFPDAQYTFIVKINDIDPGNFAGPFSNPAKIKSTVTILKTGEESVLASIISKKDYHPYALSPVELDRIASGFGEAGKMLGKFLNKKLK
jgi:hypothetical protein